MENNLQAKNAKPADALSSGEARWDLTFIYKGVNDPVIDIDVQELEKLCTAFFKNHKEQLQTSLGQAITDYSEIVMLTNKIMVYLFLQQSLDVTNSTVKTKLSEVEQKINHLQGEYLTFFTIELVALPEEIIVNACNNNEIVKKHKPWIDKQRIFKPHLLSEQVESALTKRQAFGSSAWSEFFDESEADLRFEYSSKTQTLTEMLHLLQVSPSQEERIQILKTINDGLGKNFAKYSAQTLSMVTGEMAVEGKERHYAHPMETQNKSNNIPDDVVTALHNSVMHIAGPLAQRYYKLKAVLLGVKTLSWADRNAPLPFSNTQLTPYPQALELVIKAYHSFSPTLAEIVQNFAATHKIDAPAIQGKRGGAFNYSMVMPGGRPAQEGEARPEGRPESFTFLNYLGSTRDVMTLAHELGHAVHGILAGKEQGALMSQAPIAYCETASIFGEMTTFNFLRKELEEKGDTQTLLALVTGKIEDTLNTVVRQIGFSNFERRIHGMDAEYKHWHMRRKLSVPELNEIWLQTTKELYGQEGDVFTYQDTEYLWSYVSHFHRPFYVYGYAFGELLTQSLYAQQEKFGTQFEPLYLELLKSGGTKNVVELLQPFHLQPTSETFWEQGIRVSLESMITKAEELVKKISPV